MKKTNLLKVLLVFSTLIGAVSCGESNSTSSSEQVGQLVMEDKTVTYNGEAHSIYLENIPEGATVKYTGNEKVEPGIYTVRAKVTFEDGTSKSVSAKLKIEKIKSVLTAEEVQEAFVHGGAKPVYSLDNTVQEIKVDTVYKPGVYTYDLYAPETDYYQESNHVQVTFTVKQGNNLGVVFESKEVEYDGTAQQLVATNIPDGYTVEYENNVATNQGKYNAVCKVKNAKNEVELTINAFLTIDNTPNEAFKEIEDELFLEYLGNDYYAWNVFTEKPEDFGFVREEGEKVGWYTYEKFLPEEKPEYYEYMVEYKNKIKAFENERLSFAQRVSYNNFIEFFDEQIEYYAPDSTIDPLMSLRYIDQFGGYAADFTSTAEEYILRRESDVVDLISYFESLPEAFASYVEYGKDRIEAGYPISDYTLSEMISYLNDIVSQGDEYYLEGVIGRNIDACEFLSDEKKTSFKEQIAKCFNDYFFPSFESLSTELEKLKGNCSTPGYLTVYGEQGKELYKYQLKHLLGLTDMDYDAYANEINLSIRRNSTKINTAISSAQKDTASYNSFVDYVYGQSVTGLEDPNDMITYLKEFANTIVTPLKTTPDIKIKYMDDAVAEKSNATAYYKKSALDGGNTEFITLNKKQLGTDYNNTLLTMAHEGYPGHLYEYIYNKQQEYSNFTKIATSTAHGEGWAMYVELKLLEYIKSHHSQGASNQVAVNAMCDYMYANTMKSYAAYAYIDYMIHMEGWTVSDIATYMDGLGFNADAAEDMYLTLIEMPTTYAAYGYGVIFMEKIHKDAQMTLGGYYDEIEFNKAIMQHGWCSLGELKKLANEYVSDTLFYYTV